MNFVIKLAAFLVLITFCKAQYFTAKNGKLFDANGNEFLIRGINSAHADWDNWNRFWAYNSIPSIANTGTNLIRILWRMNLQGGLTRDDLEKIILRCIQYKIVPMIEIHDATGSHNREDLLNCARWFKNNVDLLNKYQKYIIVNIANEWSPWGTPYEEWRDTYKQAVDIIRSSGYNGVLILDGSAYAQNPDCKLSYSVNRLIPLEIIKIIHEGIIKYGQYLVSVDPAKNLAFSVHMYAEWKKYGGNFNIANKLWDIQQKGLTVMVGEFALEHPDGCSWVEIDAWEIMRQCKWKNIGYIGWSWHGNGYGDCGANLAPLNMVQGDAQSGAASWSTNTYTPWGNAIVWFPEFGIKATSKPASIF